MRERSLRYAGTFITIVSMEKITRADILEKRREGIPDAEQADMELSPVTAEEMEAERKAMQEALAEASDTKTETPPVVGTEEMEAERKLMQESVEEHREQSSEDHVQIQNIREQLGILATQPESQKEQETVFHPEKQADRKPPGKTPEEGGDDGDGEKDPGHIILNEGHTEYKRKLCERCGGTGRRFFFFTCPVCRGSGSLVESEKTSWKQKAIKRESGVESAPASPENPENN